MERENEILFKSKVNIKQYLYYYFLLFLIGVSVINPFVKISKHEHIGILTYLFCTAILVFCIYGIYYFLENFPRIIITKKGILIKTLFKKKLITWNNISNIKLLGKKPLFFLFLSLPNEVTTLKLKDGSVINIWADYYKNSSQMRLILENFKLNNTISLEVRYNKRYLTDERSMRCINFTKYSGNPLLSLGSIMFIVTLILFVFILIEASIQNPNPVSLIIIPLMAVLYAIFANKMYYFLLSEDLLVIRNHFLFWDKKIYKLSDIKQVVLEQQFNAPISIRVITNNYESKLFAGQTLRRKTFEKLHKELELRNIETRTEI